MIQEYLKDLLSEQIPEFVWSVDYYYAEDNTGTVYSNDGFPPDVYDTEYRFPTYQVWIRSSDWDMAKTNAEIAYQILHRKIKDSDGNPLIVKVDYEKHGRVYTTKWYHVHLITASSEVMRIGDNEGIMEYSINFDVTLTQLEDKTITYGFVASNQPYKYKEE